MNHLIKSKVKEKKTLLLKTFCLFLAIAGLIFFPLFQSKAQNVKKRKINPRNLMLIKKGLIPPMKYFPEVPRITPQEALGILYSGKGLFIGVGHDAARIKGYYVLLDYMNYNPVKLKKLTKGTIIVVYCG